VLHAAKITKSFPMKDGWIPIHVNTVERLKDHEALKSGLGKLAPAKCRELGMTEAEAKAVEALWRLLDGSDFRIIDDGDI
jgi:hypothetical protein